MEIQERVPIKSDKVASRIIDGEAVIVVLERQETVVLNTVGSRIWETMDGQKNLNEIASILTSEFDTTYQQALKDLAEFIEDMAKQGIVTFKVHSTILKRPS